MKQPHVLCRPIGVRFPRRILHGLGVLALLLGLWMPAAQAAEMPIEQKVKGGLTLLSVERHTLPLVTLHLVFPGGSSADPVGKEGLARLCADALRGGAGGYNASELAEAVDAMGAQLDISVNRDATTISLEVLSRDLATGLSLLSDLVMRPRFPDEELERQRRRQLVSIREVLDNPAYAATVAFFEQLYRGHPYAHPVQGYEESVSAIQRVDLQDFHRGIYRPEGATLVAIGDFKTPALKKALDRQLGGWPASLKGSSALEVKLPPLPQAISGRQLVLVHRAGLTQAQIRVGNLGFAYGAEGEVPRTLLNTALGNGFTSRLVREIRVKRSLSYGASSAFVRWMQPGPFLVTTFTKSETVQETLQVALDTVAGLKTGGLDEEELSKARASVLGEFAQDAQLPELYAAALGTARLYGQAPTYVARLPERVGAATLEAVNQRRNELSYDHVLVVVYGDKDAIASQLEALGPVKVVESLRYTP